MEGYDSVEREPLLSHKAERPTLTTGRLFCGVATACCVVGVAAMKHAGASFASLGAGVAPNWNNPAQAFNQQRDQQAKLASPMDVFLSQECFDRRKHLARTVGFADDIVIVPELKAVYVDVVKSASESIRDWLSKHYGASWGNEDFSDPNYRRTSTLDITPEMLGDDWTIFSFVRDPNTRFRSSYQQAICRTQCRLCDINGDGKAMYTPSVDEFAGFVQGAQMHAFRQVAFDGGLQSDVAESWVDEHAMSQTVRLASVLGENLGGGPVPINFIGRTESFEEDWMVLMDRLGVSDPDARKPPGKIEHECDLKEREEKVMEQRDLPVSMTERAAIAALYEDDFLCFGYKKPLAWP